MALKELEVKYTQRRQRPFKLSDGGGLHLLVKRCGSKLWRLKYHFGPVALPGRSTPQRTTAPGAVSPADSANGAQRTVDQTGAMPLH